MVTPLFSASQVQEIDRAEIASGTPGIELMRRAGGDAFDLLLELWPDCDELLVVCGSGNNAGDGYVIASRAAQLSLPVRVLYFKPVDELTGDALTAAKEAEALGVAMNDVRQGFTDFRFEGRRSVIVDALLGTGFSGELSPGFERAIDWINSQVEPTYAIDLPSGISANSGKAAKTAIRAEATVSFIGRKMGLLTGAGRACAGDMYFRDLSVSKHALSSVNPDSFLLEPEALLARLHRGINTHKGSHGHVAIIGGGAGSVGAGILAAEASVRAGAGLTSLYTNHEGVLSCLCRLPEVMSVDTGTSIVYTDKLQRASVICLGPGLGLDQRAVDLANQAMVAQKPIVVDADALTLMAEKKLSKSGAFNAVLTPHPGEAARMLGISTEQVQHDRFAAVREISKRYGGVVVLKGAGTLVSDGDTVWVCDKGNPGMAVGGMGDILAGLIAALIAQGLTPLESAQLGVWAHSYAGDLAAREQGQLGLSPTDLLPLIRNIINEKTS